MRIGVPVLYDTVVIEGSSPPDSTHEVSVNEEHWTE